MVHLPESDGKSSPLLLYYVTYNVIKLLGNKPPVPFDKTGRERWIQLWKLKVGCT